MSPSRAFLSIAAWIGYLFLLMPTLIIVPMSFGNQYQFQFPPTSFSLDLYKKYFLESTWLATTWESVVVATSATGIALVLGVGAAYSLARHEFPGRKILLLFLLSPLFVPIIALALGFYLYFAPIGLSGTTLGLLLAHSVLTIPFVIITALAGLRDIDPNLEKAARIMGASEWRVLRTVTIPLLRPAIVAGGLFAFLISFDEVVIAYFVTSEQNQTLAVKMYSSIQWEISPVLAAVATLLTVLSLFICLAGAVLQSKKNDTNE